MIVSLFLHLFSWALNCPKTVTLPNSTPLSINSWFVSSYNYFTIGLTFPSLLMWFLGSRGILKKATGKLQRELFDTLRVLISLVSNIVTIQIHQIVLLIITKKVTLANGNTLMAMCFKLKLDLWYACVRKKMQSLFHL